MPRNEEGEFILELGHRQLLSVFFIIVILLGVSFTMGYIVGRNSAPVVSTAVPSQRPAAEAPGGPVTSTVGRTAASEQPLLPGQVVVNQVAPSTTGTMPAQPPATTPEPAAPAATPAKPAPTSPAPVAAPKQMAPPASAAKTDQLHADAQPGQTYLQVVAVKKEDAENIAVILRKKGFLQAIVAPGPNEAIFRVLVGPLQDAAALSKTRMDLEAIGFKSMVRKY